MTNKVHAAYTKTNLQRTWVRMKPGLQYLGRTG